MTASDGACSTLAGNQVTTDYLRGQIKSQTLTIQTLKEMLDQCKGEISRLRENQAAQIRSEDVDLMANPNPANDDLILEVCSYLLVEMYYPI